MAADKEEALKAIRDANPKWPERLVRYAYEIMPTSYDYAYPAGSQQQAYAIADFKHRWMLWAISINVMPDDTPVPPKPLGTVDMLSGRMIQPTVQRNALSRGVVTQPVEYVAPMALSVIMRNGMWPPKKDSVGEKIWQVAERLKTELGSVPSVEDLVTACVTDGVTEGVESEYNRWIRYIA